MQAGDHVEKVADGPERLTVADADALLYLPNKSHALLERALRVPALSEGWKGSFRELLAKAARGAPTAPAWSGFQPLRVAEIRRESSTITSFVLVPTEDPGSTPAAAPGQYLTVRVRPQAEQQMIRSYSLSDLPDQLGTGSGSSARARSAATCTTTSASAISWTLLLHVGSSCCARGLVRWCDQRRRGRDAGACDAARVGPRAQCAAGVVASRSAQPRRARVRGRGRRAACGAPDSHRLVAYSKPATSDKAHAGYDVSGRVGLVALEQAGVPRGADFYICGPDGFMRAIGLLAGDVTYHIEPLDPPPDGRVLVCSSRPSSELTLDL